MMSRQYIISEAVHDMTRRGEALRQPDGQDGAWITYGQMYGGFTGIGMSQQKLNVGWDIHQQDRSAGISAGYTQGHSDASAHETHKLFTLEASYARYTSAGWFMNAGGSYMHLTQTLGTDAALGMQPATQGSDFVYGNLRGGYQFSLMDNTLDIETSAGVGAGYLSGYQIDGPSAGIALSSAAPVYMTAGLKVSKKRLFSAHPDLTLNAGADYQYMPGATGSRLTLSDQHAARKWHALTEKRTYVYAGLEGKLTGNWSAEVSAGTSPRGNLYTDFSAGAGVRYSF
jgi:outer membrane autotransporter protein